MIFNIKDKYAVTEIFIKLKFYKLINNIFIYRNFRA